MTLTSYASTLQPAELARQHLYVSSAASSAANATPPPIPRDGCGYVAVFYFPGTGVSISSFSSGARGGTWVKEYGATVGSGRVEVWRNTTATPGASGTFTANFSGSSLYYSLWLTVENFDSISFVLPAGGTGTALAIPNHTTTKQNQLVYALLANRPITAGTLAAPVNGATAQQPANWEIASGIANATWNALVSQADAFGSDAYLGRTANASTSNAWIALTLVLAGPPVVLDEYTYRLGDAGLLLNSPLNILPLYDITKITGFDDIPIVSEVSTLDGVDGGYVSAPFLGSKTVVLDGTVYLPIPVDENTIDELKSAFAPVTTDIPFHFKHPGVGRRVLNVKPIGFTADIDQARARGVAPFQLQLAAADPRKYGDTKTIRIPRQAHSDMTLLPYVYDGKYPTYPVIYFHFLGTEVGSSDSMQFVNGFDIISIACGGSGGISALSAGRYKLDLGQRTLYNIDSDTNYSANLASSSTWWALVRGTNQMRFNRATASALVEEATMYYQEAFL